MSSKLRIEYDAWWRRLSKGERDLLLATGFDHTNPGYAGIPKPHRYIDSGKDQTADGDDRRGFVNFADWSMRGYDIDNQTAHAWQARMLEAETIMNDKTYTHDEVTDILSKVISVFTDSVHPAVRLHGTCIKIALGIPGMPNMSELARANDVTRAEVSRRVKNIQRKMNLPPSIFMKSDYACARLKRK